jgi:hypothetical protein
MNFWALDSYKTWGEAACKVATSRGHVAKQVSRGEQVGDGVGFIRLSMDPAELARNRQDYAVMASRLTMIQDPAQVRLYEDKSGQFAKWGEWMPDTWRFTVKDEAMNFAQSCEYPIVSKADQGASSVNVRIIDKRASLEKHIAQAFDRGIGLQRNSVQRGYVLLQRCIPHKITWRVNALGDCRAAFMRYCYPDRMVAQTGNVEPVMQMTPEVESLFEYSDRFFEHAQTKWCAIDVLKDGDQWRLLETSEGWPWPSPGTCNQAPIFRSQGRKWIDQFVVMWDEIERGAWSPSRASGSPSTSH